MAHVCTFVIFRNNISIPTILGLTLLGPQSRFGDKLLLFRVICPHLWECGSKRVKDCSPVLGTKYLQLEWFVPKTGLRF